MALHAVVAQAEEMIMRNLFSNKFYSVVLLLHQSIKMLMD